MPHHPELIAAYMGEGAALHQAVFGTTVPEAVAEAVHAFCRRELGAGVAEGLFFESSVGSVHGLRLEDGRHVALKAHAPSQPPAFLETVSRAQRHLFHRDYPCPEPLLGPRPIGSAHATVEALVDRGERADGHDPAIRRLLAEALAQQVRLCESFDGAEAIAARPFHVPSGGLYVSPPQARFDFDRTADGAAWIDRLAQRAQAVLDAAPGRMVIGHLDWSVKQCRFTEGAISAVYDWDSLAWMPEPVVVGQAAAMFPATWYMNVPLAAEPEEARHFVAEYEDARGARFSPRELQAIAAAATNVLAYCARCEHASEPAADRFAAGGFREALARNGEAYLQLFSA